MASRPALVLGDDGLPQRLQSGDTLAGLGAAALQGVATPAQAAALLSTSVDLTPGTLPAGNAAYLAGLPTALPSISGQPWNNGGMLCIS